MTTRGAVVDVHSPRDETWHYAPVDEIIARTEAAVAATRTIGTAVSRAVVDALAGRSGGPRLVFVNGFFEAALSDHDDLPPGLRFGPAGPQHADDRARGCDVATIISDPDVRIDGLLYIVHVAVPDRCSAHTPVLSRPRTIIDVGEGGHLAVIETYCGLDGPTVTDISTTIRLSPFAELDHCRTQTESSAATHIGHTRIEQGAGSRLRMISVTLGGDIARYAIDVHLDAPECQTELTGVNMTNGHQRHDTVVTIDHAASRGTSSQRFAGVVDDHGRSSFSGEIIVRPGTVATDAHQSNRNLVLDPSAEADTRPWLMILADDVRCTHGATVGRLDEDALFYLRSRGIAVAEARAMLIDAFIRDITDGIAHQPLREHIAALAATVAVAPPGLAMTASDTQDVS